MTAPADTLDLDALEADAETRPFVVAIDGDIYANTTPALTPYLRGSGSNLFAREAIAKRTAAALNAMPALLRAARRDAAIAPLLAAFREAAEAHAALPPFSPAAMAAADRYCDVGAALLAFLRGEVRQ